MILQVHDELNFSVPEAEKEAILRVILSGADGSVFTIRLKLPFSSYSAL